MRKFLKASYLEDGEYSKLAECLDLELAAAGTDEERAAVSMDMAEIYLNHLSDGEKFLEYALKAYGYRRDDPRTVTALVDFFLKNGRDSEAVPYLEWLVNYLEAKRLLKELPPYANALGRILEASGDGRRAVDFYRICHEHDAANIDNALALGRLHIRHNDMEKALRVMQPMLLRIDSLPLDQKKEILLSLARINENLLCGHFDLWHADGSLVFRNGLLLSGGADVNDAQCEALIRFAVETCDRYFPAVQFVVWAGQNAEDALAASMIETMGEA